MNRFDVIFVASVLGAAIVVYLVAVALFTANPFVWTVEHPDYAAAALVPVLPIAIVARVASRIVKPDLYDPLEGLGDAPDEPEAPTAAHEDSVGEAAGEDEQPAAPSGTFRSVEELAVASVLERGKSVAEVARTLKVRPATLEMWLARARDRD